MKVEFTLTWLKAAMIAGGALLLGLVVIWSGMISISAASGHIAPVRWLLAWTLESAVARKSMLEATARPEDLSDPSLVRRAAGHYATECAFCHAAPDVAQSTVVESMTPAPPRLEDAVGEWDDDELFWIVKNGLKYTGMPAWPTQERDDEVWAQVAFLRALPDLTQEEYRQLAYGAEGGMEPLLLSPDARDASFEQALADCARCHGQDGHGVAENAFPVIAGQPEEYLHATLLAFAEGERDSGFMGPPARRYDPEMLRELAAYYADQPATAATTALQATEAPAAGASLAPDEEIAVLADSSAHASALQDRAGHLDGDGHVSGMPVPIPSAGGPPGAFPAMADLGRRIATTGLPSRDIPACDSCHGRGAQRPDAAYPYLAGQPEWYLSEHLRLFRDGVRGGTPYAEIMTKIAVHMTDEQIEAVAAWYAGEFKP